MDGLAWGVVLSCATGLPEPLKTDNPNSPTLSFFGEIPAGTGGTNDDLMRKYLLLLFTIGLFTGCNSDYDDGKLWDSVNDLENRLSALEKQCKEMNTNIESMKVIVDVLKSNDYITNVTVVTENGIEIGYKVDFKVHPSITIYHGKDGKAGDAPRIGDNGNWWIGNQDTGVKARGVDGQDGQTPSVGVNGNWWIGTVDTGVKARGENGKDGEDGKDGEAGKDGKDGETPYVGENGNWWIGGKDTQIKARGNDGQNGETPVVGPNGNWWIGTEDTGIKAQGEDGVTPVIGVKQDVDGVYYWTQKIGDGESTWILDSHGKKIKATGEKGEPGQTPSIGSNGNWWIGSNDTGVKAKGEDGQDGVTPVIGSNGNWWIGNKDTGVKARGENGNDGKDGNDGITPRLKIENDNWMLSVDNGQTWQNLGKARGDKGDSGDSFFKSVVNGDKDLTLELEDGTVIKLPKRQVFSITLDKTRFSDMLPSTSYEVNYTIAGDESQCSSVEVIAPDDWKIVVQRTNNGSGKIVMTTPSFVRDSSKVIVLVSDENGSNMLMKTVTFLKGKISVEKTDYTVESSGEVIDVKVETNMDYVVSIATGDQSWISCEINPGEGKFTLTIQPNRDPVSRCATVELLHNSGLVLEKISITQKLATVKEIHVETAGTLKMLVSTDVLNSYENAKITGRLNTFDYDYLKLAKDLKGVDLSDLDMDTIPASAFSGSSLQTVLLPKNLMIISDSAFYQSEITSITIPETVVEIGNYAFAHCQQTHGDLVIPSNVESIGFGAFFYCRFNGELTLSSMKLKEIKGFSFYGNYFTGKLVLPLNIEKIETLAFGYCLRFTGLTLNENLLSIGDQAFSGCGGFEGDLVIPDKVQTIGQEAFYNCRNFNGVLFLGSAVQSLGPRAFVHNNQGGGNLPFKKIYFKGKTPPVFVSGSPFFSSSTLKYIGVPIGSKSGYLKLFQNFYINKIEEIEF